jgi:hypothetical protein
MRFRTFIVLAVAIAIGLGGYSFARVEHSIHQQGIELAQERLNACKFKLYDLAVGSEAHKVHLAKGPQYNPHQAEVLAGALRVVLTIPSAKECIPVIKKAIRKQNEGLTPKLERELVKLAQESTTSGSPESVGIGPAPGTHKRSHGGSKTGHKGSGGTTTTPVPPVTVTATTPAPSLPPPSTPKVKGPTVTTPSPKTPILTTPSVTTPTITTPPIEVPPVTTPKVEVPPITVPPIEIPPVKINLEEPLCKVPVVKLLTCPKK